MIIFFFENLIWWHQEYNIELHSNIKKEVFEYKENWLKLFNNKKWAKLELEISF